VLISLMAPSFAAGAITGEKERQTYEMLLASPMRPQAIVLGKLLAALCHLAIMVFASLPIVMLCLPLGGVWLYEVAATFIAMLASAMAFGMISIALSAYFTRTLAALVVSYLIILPLVMLGVLFYSQLAEAAPMFRLVLLTAVVPAGSVAVCATLLQAVSRRLLYPPDVGAEAKDVVDPDREQQNAVGMVIRSNQFPDRLFSPPKRTSLMADGLNPVYDKELRSELFGQGTLMLRLVIQLSMILALFLMVPCFYVKPQLAPLYAGYVVMFNILVGPVFAAGSITSERERRTLELLLTTTISPWEILWGKMFSSLRVSWVLTAFVAWPLLLACVLPPWTFRHDLLSMLGLAAIIVLSGLTTTTLAMFCSVLFRRTVTAMMTCYLFLLLLYAMPLAVFWIFKILPGHELAASWIGRLTFTSPFAAAFSLPLGLGQSPETVTPDAFFPDSWPHFFGYLAFYGVLNLALLMSIAELFKARWRVSGEG
jgi:ABC-type transport system involved in multi-copper enzyme maturation permease subunit